MEKKTRHAIVSSLDVLMLAVDNIQAHYKKIEAEAHMNPG
jgi:hypothetical protein